MPVTFKLLLPRQIPISGPWILRFRYMPRAGRTTHPRQQAANTTRINSNGKSSDEADSVDVASTGRVAVVTGRTGGEATGGMYDTTTTSIGSYGFAGRTHVVKLPVELVAVPFPVLVELTRTLPRSVVLSVSTSTEPLVSAVPFEFTNTNEIVVVAPKQLMLHARAAVKWICRGSIPVPSSRTWRKTPDSNDVQFSASVRMNSGTPAVMLHVLTELTH
jgi:hypothetical protein